MTEEGLEPPVGGAQSESTNATRALSTRDSPAFRAADGPEFVVSGTKRAPWRSAISLLAPGSADASSTTTHDRPASASRSRPSCTGRLRTGTTTVTWSGLRVVVALWLRGQDPGGHQPSCQPTRRFRVADDCARAPPRHQLLTPRGDPEQPEWASSEEDGTIVEFFGLRVLPQGEAGGQRCRPSWRCRAYRRG